MEAHGGMVIAMSDMRQNCNRLVNNGVVYLEAKKTDVTQCISSLRYA